MRKMDNFKNFIDRLLGYKIVYLPAIRIEKTPSNFIVLVGPLVRCKYKEERDK